MLRTSLTGLKASAKDLSVVANNLANASTTGFKRSVARFSDVIADESAVRPGASIGKGVQTASVDRSTGQGAMVSTGSSLDIAIDGGGYFVFGNAPDGIPSDSTTYSRAGHLSMDPSGNLVDDTGAQILGSAALTGNLQASSLQAVNVLSKVGGNASNINGINIGPNGKISVTTNSGTTVDVAYVAVARFPDENGLRAVGSNKLAATDSSGPVQIGTAGNDGFGKVSQGTIEKSNVDLTNELMQMIQAQQAYNGNSRALQTGSEMLRSITELVG